MTNIIYCPSCGRKMGERIGSQIRVQHHGRVVGGIIKFMTCDACKCTFDVPPLREGVPAKVEVVTK